MSKRRFDNFDSKAQAIIKLQFAHMELSSSVVRSIVDKNDIRYKKNEQLRDLIGSALSAYEKLDFDAKYWQNRSIFYCKQFTEAARRLKDLEEEIVELREKNERMLNQIVNGD